MSRNYSPPANGWSDMNYKISKKWSHYLPALDEETQAMLENSILDEGQREPIVVTQDGTVIDGHNRLEICQRHSIEPTFQEVEFEDENDIESWVIANQLGRRNLVGGKRNYFRGRLVELQTSGLEKSKGGRGKTEESQLAKALDDISKSENVSTSQLRRDKRLAGIVDSLAPSARREFLASPQTLLPEWLDAISDLPAREQKTALRQALDNGKAKQAAPKKAKPGSRKEFLQIAERGHDECHKRLTQIRKSLRQLAQHEHSEGYLSGQMSRIEELISDLQGYVSSSVPVRWSGKRWMTKLDDKQRDKSRRKNDSQTSSSETTNETA